ncbi:beta-galactosidase [Paenibacillus sp. YAF4_2]|uniref:beta-galactosidase n=1 Tax=Paenibacillus sp. YAF4_2 TaxID=3233085 RepID=UPI003F9E6CCC
MRMGMDYYPEHWDRSMWEEDAKLMQDTGVSLIRVAEFAWSRLEPTEGNYDFEWLDDAIDTFARHGIKVVIGTPTCTPPNWLVKKYPDVLPIDAQLHPHYPGVRGHRCFNSPSMRHYSFLIVEKLALHYKDHSAVIGWQIDNEFGLHECNCEHCNTKFRDWLKDKYSSVENINAAWGNVVWSGEYSEWSEITTPLGGNRAKNPSYLLDYKRFETDSVVEFQQLQLDILKKHCPNHFVTHNIWSYPMSLDYYKLGEKLDFVSLDYYPSTSPEKDVTSGYSGALTLDLTRGIKRQNFWIMETISGPPGCWMPMWRTPYPGFIRAYSWQCIARGADTIVHFRWRSAPSGGEQFWHGLIDHSNVPGRRYEEYRGLCDEVNRLAPLLEGTQVKGKVAILHSHDQYNAFQGQLQSDGMDYFENIKTLHRAFTKLGIMTDVLSENEDLTGYKLIVAPSLFLLDTALASKFDEYVKNGATLVVLPRTGVKNPNNVCWIQPLPGPLSESAGVTVAEYDPIGKDKNSINWNNKSYSCSQWCDILTPQGAEPVARYEDDFYAGKIAATVHTVDKGKVYYLGTFPEESFYSDFFKDVADTLGLTYIPNLPEGVQVSIRSNGEKQYMFLLNLSRKQQTIQLEQSYYSVLNNKDIAQELNMNPYDVEIVELL